MAKTGQFDAYAGAYDLWFERNRLTCDAETRAIRSVLPTIGRGLDIGAGSGRFSRPFNMKFVVEPSLAMALLARGRGLTVLRAVAEYLPFRDSVFDFALMVTVICFVDDLDASFKEASRVLKPHGSLVVGFLDKDRAPEKPESPFYKDATLYPASEVKARLMRAGFKRFAFRQTVFKDPCQMKAPEPVSEGFGKGAFVVIRADKQ